MRLIRAVIVAALSMAAVAFCIAPAEAEKRVALVIGNSAYKNVSQLANSTNDAKAISEMLRSAGFDAVELYENLNIREMRRAINDFSDIARHADTAVVYYSGHGIEVNGVNYLIPIDAVLDRDSDVPYETFSLENLVQLLEPARRLRLVMLDACRDNPFARNMKRTIGTRAVSRGLAAVEPTSVNTLIGFAAKAGSYALDGDGANSPYALALVNNLAMPGLDLRIAFGRVRDEVLKSTRSKQEPFVYGSLGGNNISIVDAPGSSVATLPPQTSTTPIDRAAQAWGVIQNTTSIAVIQDFIRQFGGTPYGSMARARLEELKKNQVAVVAPPAALAQLLQIELKRVGCNTGATDGGWSSASRSAMAAFNRHAKTKFEIEAASVDALDAVRSSKSRICPLECEPGFRAANDKCIEIPKTAARPNEASPPKNDREQRQLPPASTSTQRVACDRFGCRAVPPKCHVVKSFDDQFGPNETIVCP